MRRILVVCGFLLVLASVLAGAPSLAFAQTEVGDVIFLQAEGAISPGMERYLRRGIEVAERQGAELVVIQLDTPGGEVGVTGKIVELLSDARVPVAVYVAPSGARAASAGTLITLAADVAAMAPRTRIGAASVVGGEGDLPPTVQRKAENDVAALARSLAAPRGEEAVEWADEAVRSAVSATAEEARALGVVDVVADDVDDLLEALDGRVVMVGDERERLDLDGALVREVAMNPLEGILQIITDPNVALLLLSFGSAAILIELYSPGGYVAGMAGLIALILAFYGLGNLDANWAGVALIALALVLFVVDVQSSSHGIWTVGGVTAFVLGSILLFNTSFVSASFWLIAVLGLGMGAFSGLALTAALRSRRLPAVTGQTGMIGRVGEVRSPLDPRGFVLVHGERWRAMSAGGSIPVGTRVRILGVDGLYLLVEPLEQPVLPASTISAPPVEIVEQERDQQAG